MTTHFTGDIYSGGKKRVNVRRWIPKKSKACLHANVSRKKKTFTEEKYINKAPLSRMFSSSGLQEASSGV